MPIAGKEGNPTPVPYSSAKAGVLGLTKALAKEVATRGILVNAVAPAVIGTELLQQMERSTVDLLISKIPMGRVGQPEEVAALAVWLASEECSFMEEVLAEDFFEFGRSGRFYRREDTCHPSWANRRSPSSV